MMKKFLDRPTLLSTHEDFFLGGDFAGRLFVPFLHYKFKSRQKKLQFYSKVQETTIFVDENDYLLRKKYAMKTSPDRLYLSMSMLIVHFWSIFHFFIPKHIHNLKQRR